MQRRYSNDVAVLTLNVDFDEESGIPSAELVDRVTSEIADTTPNCENYICSTPTETVLGELDLFGLPAVLLFDKTGRISHRFDGNVDVPGELDNNVRKLLRDDTAEGRASLGQSI